MRVSGRPAGLAGEPSAARSTSAAEREFPRRAGAKDDLAAAQNESRLNRTTVEPAQEDPAASYSPARRPCSTIGAGGLNFRVRDGNGCDTSAIATGNWKNFDNRIWATKQGKRNWSQSKIVVKPHGQLVPVSYTHYYASTPGLSTSSSSRGLQGPCGPGIPYLGGGFPLICFQRLSRPHIATRQCGWRHNRNTSGAFLPVLSY